MMLRDHKEFDEEGFNREVYRPSGVLRAKLLSTINRLRSDAEYTQTVGSLLGTTHYKTSGWTHDEQSGNLIELTAEWMEKRKLFRRSQTSTVLKSIAVWVREPSDQQTGRFIVKGPYREFRYNNKDDTIKTYNCKESYPVDTEGFTTLTTEMITGYMQAQAMGEDIVFPDLEEELIGYLDRADEAGWLPSEMTD